MTEIVRDGWRDVLTALDSRRSVICGESVREWPAPLIGELTSADLLTEIAPADTIACPGCPEAPFRDVISTDCHTNRSRVLLACPNCGLQDISQDDLRRWRVDREAILRVIRSSLPLSGRASEALAGRVWRLGRLNRNGTHWSVWFGCHLFRRDAVDIPVRVPLPERSLLLVPGRLPVRPLPGDPRIGSLRELTEWSGELLQWDAEHLDELLHVSAAESSPRKKPAPTRRQSRAADIDALVAELKQHLRTARDHACHTRESRGVPALLPRPAQKDLARRLGMTESRVSRSLRDERATELRLLWTMAGDLDQVLRFVT